MEGSNNFKLPDKSICTNEEDQYIPSEEITVTRSFKSSLSQCIAALATNIIKFTFGTFFGFNTVLTAVLYKKDAEIDVSFSELTWFSSFCFMVPVGSIIFGLLAQRIGSRIVLLIASVTYTICWIMFYYATNVVMLLIAQAMVGLTYSISIGPGSTYTAEISQPHLRSTLLATTNLFILFGSFFSVLLGSLVYWRTITLINVVFPIIGFIAVLFIPESPYWLASKGRLAEAELSLSWLRGWVSPDKIRSELQSLKETSESSRDIRDISGLKNICKIYLHKVFYLPLLSICYMFVMHILSGSLSIMIYAILLFEMINSPVDKHIAAVIFDALKIVAAICCVSIIHYTGKRKLLFFALFGTAFCYLTISIFLYLLQRQILLSDSYYWVPTIMMMLATFICSGGTDKIVYMMNVELFPTRLRSVGAGIGLFVSALSAAIMNKMFLSLIDFLSLEGLFIFFALMNATALVTFYFIFPETNRKSLKEIEDYYKGISFFRNKSKLNKVVENKC